jgi:hypothetical protein
MQIATPRPPNPPRAGARSRRRALLGAGALLLATACDQATSPRGASGDATRSRPVGSVAKVPRFAGAVVVAADGTLSTSDLSAQSPTALVQAMVGSGVTVSNVRYTGDNTAAGTFTGPAEIVGFDGGILLSTGDVASVAGPNEQDAITEVHNTPGDGDLTTLAGFETFDASVLEFDFVPAGDSLVFQYVFASDEYNEFVNTEFNDVFAFYVNGTNCAVVGNPAQPVSINTINNGNPEDDPTASNPALYRNNDLDDGGGSINTEMDGLTTVLTCRAKVNPGVTNRMKLAIADASDPVLDAAVFIKAGSFAVPNRPPSATITAPASGASFAQGATVSLGGSATDPEDGTLSGAALVWSSSINGVLGTGATISSSTLGVGTHTITLTAKDAGGATATATIQLTITAPAGNQPPTSTLALSPKTITVGGSTAATTGASDPDDAAGDLACSIDWGDGAVSPFGSCTAARNHTYTAAGLFTVTFTARDPDGATGASSDTVRVVAAETNTPPEIVNLRGFPEGAASYRLGDKACYALQQVCIKYTIRDVDAGDTPFRTTVSWGDGTPTYVPNAIAAQNVPLLAYHTYAAAGSYTVTVTATDRRGASSTRTIPIVIAP